MSKIILEGYILVPGGDLVRIKEELPNHIALTRQEKGCVVFEVSQCTENLNRFSVYEEFTSQASFELHQARVNRSKWGSVSENVERHYQIRRIE